jgi:uncharacterized membrane protein YphA (DoxX/SURF4 family)
MDLSTRRLGFITLFTLVVLRTAIGWHFLYEGAVKIESRRSGLKPWTSEWYLKAATGPFAPHFKEMADPDPFQLDSVNPQAIQKRWQEDIERYTDHYHPESAQVQIVEASHEEAVRALTDHFDKKENWEQLQILRQEVADWTEASSQKLLTHEQNELNLRREKLEKMRDEIAAPIKEIDSRLRNHMKKILTPEQSALGPPPEPVDMLEVVDQITMWGLALVGLLMLLGLFSRLAALGAVGFLALFYIAMPPWPGVPSPPIAEGNYLIVNKNLVELIACLVLVMVPTGKWLGLDALVGKLFRRRKAAPHGGR